MWLGWIIGLRRWRREGAFRYRAIGRDRKRSETRYEVRGPAGTGIRVTESPSRRFDDLDGVDLESRVSAMYRWVRPGDRVLVLGAGTGGLAAAAGELVGSSGSVASLEEDGASVRYARVRYPCAWVSIEVGGLERLSGELDGAFDACVLGAAWRGGRGAAEATEEITRVVRAGGWVVGGDAAVAAVRGALGMDLGTRREGLCAVRLGVEEDPEADGLA